jgi:hypothetical protein
MPSAGPHEEPPERPTFFIDRDTGGRLLAAALRADGWIVHTHDSQFQPDTPDPFWIRTVAERGWTILTCDRAIARKEPEKSLFGTAPVCTFILYALTQVPREQRIGLVKDVLPKLAGLVASGSHGIHRVFRDGRVERVPVKPKFRFDDF